MIAAAGPSRRTLPAELPAGLRLPDGFRDPRVVLPGHPGDPGTAVPARRSTTSPRSAALSDTDDPIRGFPLIVIVDDSEFTARNERNFLWVTFTRSNPAADIEGIGAFIDQKHWGCTGPLVIDARIKPHHAPPLVDDPGDRTPGRPAGRARRPAAWGLLRFRRARTAPVALHSCAPVGSLLVTNHCQCRVGSAPWRWSRPGPTTTIGHARG